ncbi:hypothetical protein VTK73DRAFT_3971 [Phialemonium thermophilum]|uniref:Indoleamine 2,3-dioxygenase n=1 Tax=Phialemonium thermophilum TaxID=223376 RepID=A0ABR3WWX9_9PEZI
MTSRCRQSSWEDTFTLSDPRGLAAYAVTQNGFLPDRAPLRRLPDPYYAPWEALIDTLPSSTENGTLRTAVEQLPVLSAEDRLKTIDEQRRAYVILSFLTHAYVWGGDTPAEILPPSISIPLVQISTLLELPPVATYAALNLWNFTSSNNDFTDLDSLHALHTFTGTKDESWFYVVSVAMEAQGGYIIPVMIRALEAAKRQDHATVISALHELCNCIRLIGWLLDRMYEKCNPNVFYHQIRPFLAGSKNMGPAGLPRGLFYGEGDGRGQWLEFRGGSNGQSSLIQFFDLVLGVTHTSTGNSSPESRTDPLNSTTSPSAGSIVVSFHEEVRSYMPGPHRRFLERVARLGSIRDFAAAEPGDLSATAVGLHEELRRAFREATETLATFRNKHLQIVTRYIVIPSRMARGPNGGPTKVNLANVKTNPKKQNGSCGRDSGTELTGTGGTALLPFLKQSRDETTKAGELYRAAKEG